MKLQSSYSLLFYWIAVYLYCVFHSIRFKVNKDWLLVKSSLFLCPKTKDDSK